MFKRVTQSPMKELETSAATAPAALRMTMTVEEMEERGDPVHHNTLEALDELRGHSHE